MSEDVFRWVIAVTAIVACLAFLAQTGVFFALYRTTRNVQNIAQNVQNRVAPLADRAGPVLDTIRQMVEENRPRIQEITTEAVAVVRSARDQVDQVGHFGDAVRGAIFKSVKEVNGIASAIKAAFATYAQGGRRPSVDHATQDEEMFI